MGYEASHQAILIHLGSVDTLKEITLRYRRFGRSPEDEQVVANMLRVLDDNRRRWIRSRPHRYFLRVKRDCFCFGAPLPTYEVLDGMAIATIDSGGVRHALRNEAGMTIDSLFDDLRANLLDERRYVHAVRYDQHYGWPSRYRTGATIPMNDAWMEVTVERFDVVR